MRTDKALSFATSLLFAASAHASSHREAPLITEDPAADSTDVYMFRSPDDPSKVTILANYIPLEEPAGGPNFHQFSDSVLYEIKIDNDGDAVEDIIYQFRFRTARGNNATFLYNTGPIASIDDPNWNVKQFYDLSRIDIGNTGARTTTVIGTNLKSPPVRVGEGTFPTQADYETVATQAIQTVNPVLGGQAVTHKVFAGARDEGFFIDLGAIFDLINLTRIDLNLPDDELGKDYTSGFNVHTLGIQVPITALTANGQAPTDPLDPNAVIGTWTSASRKKHTVLRRNQGPDVHGSFIQVSRLGLPLINELVMPLGSKDQFSRTEPKDDVANFGPFVLDPELARLLFAIHSVPIPPAPRNDMLDVISFFPGVLSAPGSQDPAHLLRLNVAIAPVTPGTEDRLGVIGGDVAGFPNGRRVGDDVVDILERVVGGGVLVTGFNVFPNNALNDGVATNDVPFLTSFPYLGTPNDGFNRVHE